MNVEKYSAPHPPITVGTRVAQSRKEHGLTQEELAERVGCDRSNISRIERDRVRPSVKLARQLARQLVPPNQVKAFMHAALQVPAPQLVSFSPLASPHHANPSGEFAQHPLPEALSLRRPSLFVCPSLLSPTLRLSLIA